MSYVAAKAFNTTLRRVAAGAPVNDGDELAPHTIDSLKAAGLITAAAFTERPAVQARKFGAAPGDATN